MISLFIANIDLFLIVELEPTNNIVLNRISSLRVLETETYHEETPQSEKKNCSIEEITHKTNQLKISLQLPEQAPATFYSFEHYWRMLRGDREALSVYFKMIDPQNIPNLMKESLSSEILFSYIDVILNIYIPKQDIEFSMNILRALSVTPRFKLQNAFLTAQQKDGMIIL